MSRLRIKNSKFGVEKLEVEDGWTEKGGFLEADISFMSETVANGGLKPWEEIKRTAEFWEKTPITLNHPEPMPLQDTDEVIGFIEDVEVNEDAKRLDGKARIWQDIPEHNDRHTDTEWQELVDTVTNTDAISVGYHYQEVEEGGTIEDHATGEELEYDYMKTKFLPDHTAILDGEEPAVPPERGTGINIERSVIREMGYEIVEEVEEVMQNHQPTPIEDDSWDADQADKDLRRYAGGPDKEDIDWDRYFNGFAWRDGDDPDNFTSYKLPHHKVQDGEIVTSRAGVIAAGNAVQGARGGVDIPEGDMSDVKSHLETHYNQFEDLDPPWQEESGEDMMEDKIDVIKNKLKEISKKLEANMSDTEEPEQGNEPDKGTESNRLREVEAELEKVKKRNKELEEQLEEYREQERERLVTKITENTDLSEEDLEDKTVDDLKSMLEGIESIVPKDSEQESGKNLNSPPNPDNPNHEEREKGSVLGGGISWKNKDGE